MKQLKMIRYSSKALKDVQLPIGYTLEFFKGSEEEISDWLDICVNGLLEKNDRECFKNCITDTKGLCPETDLFFVLSPDKKRVATAIGYRAPEGNGWVHMVCASPDARGLGIGHFLIYKATELILSKGCPLAILTTDDFRLAAIKTYLDAGFLPYIYEDPESSMEQRWQAVLTALNYKETEFAFEE